MKSKFTLVLVAVFITLEMTAQDGLTCATPFVISDVTTYTAGFDNCWYTFTTSEDGLYNINTCGLSGCDTKIWVYENCPPDELAEGPEGALIYNDDYCDLQSNVNFVADPGEVFLIRIGDYYDDCGFPVDWQIVFLGEVLGCIDPLMCNFNPLASTDDGSCITFEDPNCVGPDLLFDEDELIGSLEMLVHWSDDCDVEEGCVTGYGVRQVITFSSKIDNIGQQDYYIGNPYTNPEMFNTENCHGHAHYEGYGDYKLVDMDGNIVPAGHKNGFCVMDLCGFGQYDCGDMGISAGCYDVYGAGTQCQWIDVTEIPDGDYRLIALVNPFYLPDALGREEDNVINNMTTVCLHIIHDENDVAFFELLDDCPEYTDCAGVVNGNSWPDCNGDCNGSAVFGDVAVNSELDSDDLSEYMNLLSQFPVPVSSCNDLSGNSELTVYDIALNNQCQNAAEVGQDVLSNCNFPMEIQSMEEPCGLAISDFDLEEGWIEIEMTTTEEDVLAYQFSMSGIEISGVVSVLPEDDFSCSTGYNVENNQVFAYSMEEALIENDAAPKSICRIYFSTITANLICIEAIQDIVNEKHERTQHYIYGDCITTVGVAEVMNSTNILLQPNPANDAVNIFISSPSTQGELVLRDALGREVLRQNAPAFNRWNTINIETLQSGVYTMSLVNGNVESGKTRLVKE